MGKVQKILTDVELNTTTSKEEMTKKKDVEDACHDENRRKLSLTSNNPLMHRQISQEIGVDKTYEICLKIL